MNFHDRSVLESASWRLASELMRRHPTDARLFRGHPGGGNYDVLWIMGLDGSNLDIRLNRVGTIQIHGCVDRTRTADWRPTEWSDYLSSDPRTFIERMERAAGWPAQEKVPQSTPVTLTYRILAAMASFGMKTVHPITIEEGFIDSSGEDGGPNPILDHFTLPAHLSNARHDDFYGQPGYRFWIPVRDEKPLCAIEQTSGLAFFVDGSEPIDLMERYRANKKEVVLVAAELLSRAVGVD